MAPETPPPPPHIFFSEGLRNWPFSITHEISTLLVPFVLHIGGVNKLSAAGICAQECALTFSEWENCVRLTFALTKRARWIHTRHFSVRNGAENYCGREWEIDRNGVLKLFFFIPKNLNLLFPDALRWFLILKKTVLLDTFLHVNLLLKIN